MGPVNRPVIRRIDLPEADQAEFDGLVVVYRETDAERDPTDPPPSRREILADLSGSVPVHKTTTHLATVDGEPAGLGWSVTISEADDELQVAEVEILVRPRFRRQGVATALMGDVLTNLAALGQTSIVGYCNTVVASESAIALCKKFGLTERGTERCSRAKVSDVDESLLAGWIDDAASSAPGYRLELWEGVCPDHLAERWSQAMAAMEDEPLDDFDFNPHTRGAEMQRQADMTKRAQGYRFHRALALSPTGEAAGLSAVYVHEDRPQLAEQADTGVLAEHRGHRLGRWLKAANYQAVRRAHPELLIIETYNAQSNPWMLDINVAMGFAPHHYYVGYQGSVEKALAVSAS